MSTDLKIKKLTKESFLHLKENDLINNYTLYIYDDTDDYGEDAIGLFFGDRTLKGLISTADKAKLDALYLMLGEEETANQLTDTVKEVLNVFGQYPDIADLLLVLTGQHNIKILPSNIAEQIGDAHKSNFISMTSSSWERDGLNEPSFVASSSPLSATTFAAQDLVFSSDGLKLYVIESTTDSIHQYSLSVAYDVSSLNTTPVYSKALLEPNAYGLFFKPDGTSYYYVGSSNKKIYQVNLNTPWNLWTAVEEKESYETLTNGTYHSLFFSADGTKVYILNSTKDLIQIHNLSTAWDITTFIRNTISTINVVNEDASPTGMYISPDGQKLFVVGSANDKVHEYVMDSPWGTYATYTNRSIDVPQNVTTGLTFKPDGTYIFLIGSTTKCVDAFHLPSAFNFEIFYGISKETKETFKFIVEPVPGPMNAVLKLYYFKDEESGVPILEISKDGLLSKVTMPFSQITNLPTTLNAYGITDALSKMKPITWSALKNLRDTSKLIPGQQYRITDYVTTTLQANTQSTEHQFDIIVTADDVDKLNENARACLHEGDTYFANSKLEAWKLKYCLDNDVTRFAWADVRHLQFDNKIYFLSSRVVRIGSIGSIDYHLWVSTDVYGYETYLGTLSTSLQTGDSLYYIIPEGEDYWYIEDSYNFEASMLSVGGKGVIYNMVDEFNNDVPYDFKNIKFLREGEYIYTFHYYDDVEGGDYDLSLNQYMLFDFPTGEYTTTEIGCHTNIIKPYYNQTDGSDVGHGHLQFLNFITFRNFAEAEGQQGYRTHCCYSNFFDFGCRNISFDKCCSLNSFGCDCRDITFGDNCNYNRFGKNNHSNTFGDGCEYISFGDYSSFNTFGNECKYNTFGNSCNYNAFGRSCYFSTFGNGCWYLRISNDTNTLKKNIHVENGTKGTSNLNKFDLYDPAISNKEYQVTFKKSASGKYLMLWANDNGTMTGKVKATATTATWSDIV